MAITVEQAKTLAQKLDGTRNNVYRLAETLGFPAVEDSDFDLIEKEGKVFRCEECSAWMDVAEQSKDDREFCAECYEEVYGQETED